MVHKILLKVNEKLINQLHFNHQGLIPTVVQNKTTGEILMLAYVNQESLDKTIESGIATFWSRSRQKLWMKGETSGNIQRVKEILVDCDCDAILYLVEQKGNACHTGRQTCFHNKLKGEIV